MALLPTHLGRGCWVCCKKLGASSRPPQSYVQTFRRYSFPLFYNPFLICFTNLRKHEQRSPLGFVETNNDCVSELIRFPLGLDYAPHKAEASPGVRNSEWGGENSDISESFKQIPPLPSHGQNTWVSSVLRWKSLHWEISFVVSSFTDSARFGCYSQDLSLRTFAVLSECSCWETFPSYSCLKALVSWW